MLCPFCGARDTRVVDSRVMAEEAQVRRRRECGDCGGRFTTFEVAELKMPRIVKRDGKPEPFSEPKLRRGMERALYKRPVSVEQIEAAIAQIKRKLVAISDRDIDAGVVGNLVMDALRELDHVAYVRFASVYRDFEDVEAFRAEIERLQAEPDPAEVRRQQLSLISGER
ncbi:transcriptional regulator NrdR [Abyssibacter profundi]|uniref:Transcriptional repressor NrdR n=1 Tax=Abyssibacter profundi TaxID=2182787 RepID=A0A363UL67_9GAMM|nr:transcriptional regulator NrdR [Abyssibacter profundi]MBV61900.1 transcriptional regulator NrdR [Nevskiales bacterium]PWN56161.1 transcriptional regulator NrdR [Abyssibacter profundi]